MCVYVYFVWQEVFNQTAVLGVLCIFCVTGSSWSNSCVGSMCVYVCVCVVWQEVPDQTAVGSMCVYVYVCVVWQEVPDQTAVSRVCVYMYVCVVWQEVPDQTAVSGVRPAGLHDAGQASQARAPPDLGHLWGVRQQGEHAVCNTHWQKKNVYKKSFIPTAVSVLNAGFYNFNMFQVMKCVCACMRACVYARMDAHMFWTSLMCLRAYVSGRSRGRWAGRECESEIFTYLFDIYCCFKYTFLSSCIKGKC